MSYEYRTSRIKNPVASTETAIHRRPNPEDSLSAGRRGGHFDRTGNLMASQEALLVVTPAKAGVQKTIEKRDSRLRGNEMKRRLLTL
jgi:hypothetical protein